MATVPSNTEPEARWVPTSHSACGQLRQLTLLCHWYYHSAIFRTAYSPAAEERWVDFITKLQTEGELAENGPLYYVVDEPARTSGKSVDEIVAVADDLGFIEDTGEVFTQDEVQDEDEDQKFVGTQKKRCRGCGYLMIADERTLGDAEDSDGTVLFVDLTEFPGLSFRVVPEELPLLTANLVCATAVSVSFLGGAHKAVVA